MTSSFTFARPWSIIPIRSAAEDETSTVRPRTNGPAAVNSLGLNFSPLRILPVDTSRSRGVRPAE